ncbi:hypothetical protein FH972_021288 [Carpinus fangiana]|uniref:Uncharacterized protein n=1 Tax=Carpinus fangiana TaxID=176857 RepID=A0A5N6KP40_9ROSI|nr:hypothetical protein FH972_021288 [Carpinus fangiana]
MAPQRPRSARGSGAGLKVPNSAGRSAPGRPLLYTLAFAATTIMGTYYGAGLKMQSEATAAKEQAREKTTQEKIEALQHRRAGLVQSLEELEEKLNGTAPVKDLGNGRGNG